MRSVNSPKDLLETVSFQAFNRSFILHLHPTADASFHVLRVKEGNSSLEFLRKCLYQGYLENEESSSAVALSACHGWVSYSMENVSFSPNQLSLLQIFSRSEVLFIRGQFASITT
ncbi:hypothetical protein TNIN_116091 [Trichonephila inaurata madagascariensis]|uniref:Peptidase M12B propeptide domain-containing protein n=1 Tax=Trichonephila inaurata madagascariensis TaxID=2747483 RepID=A0A8X7BPC2_9ARAC|nr:hypothetical protein TNIN_116091 [Trichonephila inaurata madagascariensis]